MIPLAIIDEDITRWMKEDIPYWDVTTSLLPKKNAKAKIYAKQEGIIAGLTITQRIFEFLDGEFNPTIHEGAFVNKKQQIAEIKGPLSSLLQAERLALNILGRLSGIATQTAAMLEKARLTNPKMRVCGTRKTLPGFAKYDKYAITVGGGDTHRFNLSDMVLLKENHLKHFKSITEAIETARNTISFSKKIEVEVQNEQQAFEAAKAKADIIMLDNFSPIQANLIVPKIRELNHTVLIEISGNIEYDNLELYSFEGIDMISSGALTHSVKNFDLTMLME